ncbi:PEP-CTERM sorting domain-containing protein [Kiritimatiella glycovorans]|nr:PEP-CTERM sorting domain-containing protein [Kiritimatiella glycovorans]
MVALILFAAGAQGGDNFVWIGNGTQWTNGASWNQGGSLPGVGDNALFTQDGKGGYLNDDVGTILNIQVARGKDDPPANSLTINSGGAVECAAKVYVGYEGVGTLTLDGGSVGMGQDLFIASDLDADGVAEDGSTVNLNSGSLTVDRNAFIGHRGRGYMKVSGGSLTLNGDGNMWLSDCSFQVLDDDASIRVNNAVFAWGDTNHTGSADVSFRLSDSAGVSTISAQGLTVRDDGDDIGFTIDAGDAPDGAFSVTLFKTTNAITLDAFNALTGVLQTVNIEDWTLSREASNKELEFSGTVIPEPATFGLLGLFGLLMVLRRRIMA